MSTGSAIRTIAPTPGACSPSACETGGAGSGPHRLISPLFRRRLPGRSAVPGRSAARYTPATVALCAAENMLRIAYVRFEVT
jgi:hypothetical protein